MHNSAKARNGLKVREKNDETNKQAILRIMPGRSWNYNKRVRKKHLWLHHDQDQRHDIPLKERPITKVRGNINLKSSHRVSSSSNSWWSRSSHEVRRITGASWKIRLTKSFYFLWPAFPVWEPICSGFKDSWVWKPQ